MIVDLHLVDFAIKTDTKILITLERDLNKLLESNTKVAAIPSKPNAIINIYDRPDITLNKTADFYLSGILRSETALRQSVFSSPYQQLFEIGTGSQSFTCTFKGTQIQFDWLEISIVYDKSYQHNTIYDSYDLELAARLIKYIKFENTSTMYSLTGKRFFDLQKDDDKNILYKMLVAYNCEGCSSAPLTQYKNNEIYQ